MGARLQDVAERAGVSIKTVSNVVRGTGSVKPETRARIADLLRELNYSPNTAARNLRAGRSGMVTVALPSLEQPYFAELASKLVAAAQARDLTVVLVQSGGSEESEWNVIEGTGVPRTDGLIISPLSLSAADLTERRSSTPLVLLGEHIGDTALPQVTIDNRAAAEAATRHLLTRGYRRIGAVGVQVDGSNETSTLRLDGYRRAHQEAAISVDEQLLLRVADFSRTDGAQAVDRLLARRTEFDALFCFNDLMALGAIRALRNHGLSVPSDVAVVGFDDIEESRFSVPSLTTMSPDRSALAEAAIDLVLAENPDNRRAIDCRLVVRESTGGHLA